jgi:hypothetical protein
MLHKSTQHSTIGYVTDGSVTAFAAGRAPDDAGRAQSGTARMVLVTGDRADIAETIGRIVGVAAVYPDRDPAERLAIVRAGESAPTIMVGDGVNDAPRARGRRRGSGVAARGTTASAEVADVVLTADRLTGSPTRFLSPAAATGARPADGRRAHGSGRELQAQPVAPSGVELWAYERLDVTTSKKFTPRSSAACTELMASATPTRP